MNNEKECDICNKPPEEQYEYFMFGGYFSKKKRKNALNRAHEIRKFEIDLYWRRSIYFWGFQAVMFVALANIITNWKDILKTFNHPLIPLSIIFLISGMGLFISIAWLCVTKASKAYQKNWETHIDFLESHFEGNLYRTVIGDKKDFFSISNINIWVVGAWCLFWGIVFIVTCFWILKICIPPKFIELHSIICIIIPIFIFLVILLTILLICIPNRWRPKWYKDNNYKCKECNKNDRKIEYQCCNIRLRKKKF